MAGLSDSENVPKIELCNTVKLYIFNNIKCIMFEIFYISGKAALFR